MRWWSFGRAAAVDKADRQEAVRQRAELQRLASANREAELARQAEDLQALAHGGIPVMARKRLTEQAQDPMALFTSDLSPSELGLLRQNGYRARGLVAGSAMYHVGQPYASSVGDCEVTVLSQAYDNAMDLAVRRVEQEARLLGAHGVVGVRVGLIRHEWTEQTIEVTVIGTAVEGPAPAPARPWLCDLSVEEWWALHRAGYDPVDLVWGHSAWFVLTTQVDEFAVRSWSNTELGHWSQALGQARIRAMMAVKKRAQAVRASGVVGVRISHRLDEVRLSGGEGGVYEREHHNLVMAVIGTAVRSDTARPSQHRAALMMLSLADGRLAPAGVGKADLDVQD